MRELYVRNPEPFFVSSLRDRLRLSKNVNDFRTPVTLHEGYFIESNLSNTAKFERIQEALTLFDAEDDLIIRYAN
jgi:Ca2+-binding EF-hand superfamily protein